jgi:hypothetical protein
MWYRLAFLRNPLLTVHLTSATFNQQKAYFSQKSSSRSPFFTFGRGPEHNSLRDKTRLFSILATFMDYDLGYFDLETRVPEPLENPFGPKVLELAVRS